MSRSSLVLAISHLKGDFNKASPLPAFPWPRDDGDDSSIFSPILSPDCSQGNESLPALSPSLLLAAHTARALRAQPANRALPDLMKSPAPGPLGMGGFRARQ